MKPTTKELPWYETRTFPTLVEHNTTGMLHVADKYTKGMLLLHGDYFGVQNYSPASIFALSQPTITYAKEDLQSIFDYIDECRSHKLDSVTLSITDAGVLKDHCQDLDNMDT